MTVTIPEEQLTEIVRGERWFGAKTQELNGAHIVDYGVLRPEPQLADALVELRYGSGMHDVYQLLLGPAGTDVADEQHAGTELARLLSQAATVATAEGEIAFTSFDGGLARLPLERSRPMGAEQSNTSLVVDDRAALKLYRHIEPGENPELEVLRFLATHGFENAPALLGWWSYAGTLLAATLGIAQQYVPDTADGWTLALSELVSEPDAFAARAQRLGEVVGAMHVALASDPEDPAFCSEESSPESVALMTATIDEDIEQVFLHLPDDDDAVAPIIGLRDAVHDLLRSLASVGSVGRRIRDHGDLHLGQVLWTGEDWLVIDFEGEPARHLTERRAKRSPLRDVAGMLRSFTYAAAVAGMPGCDAEHRSRAEFLDAYTSAVQPAGLLPNPAGAERLLRIFELEKAVYELGYELSHRPDWVPIPVAGIIRLLEEASA